MPKPTIIHKTPLTLILKDDGTVDITCEVPGITIDHPPGQLVLTHKAEPGNGHHLYCYTISPPRATAQFIYYAIVLAGPHPEALKPWPQQKGVSTSPTFDIDDVHAASCCLTVVVTAEPRLGDGDAVNGPRPEIAAAPRPYVGRRHVKSEFQGGGDRIA